MDTCIRTCLTRVRCALYMSCSGCLAGLSLGCGVEAERWRKRGDERGYEEDRRGVEAAVRLLVYILLIRFNVSYEGRG